MINNDDDLEFEGQNDPDTEVIIDPIKNNKESIYFGIYSQMNALANFYNRIQAHLKKIAIVWLVAGLTALGFLFAQDKTILPFSPYLIGVFILLADICGITLIWFIDICVYQTYFMGAIIENIKLERKYNWLPKISTYIGKLQMTPKKRMLQGYFYIGCNIMLLLFICCLLLALVNYSFYPSLIIFISTLLLSILLILFMYRIEVPKKMDLRKEYTKSISN